MLRFQNQSPEISYKKKSSLPWCSGIVKAPKSEDPEFESQGKCKIYSSTNINNIVCDGSNE